jgi:hypothetical protein
MLGFKRFRDSTVTISRIELMHRIRQGPLGLTDVRLTETSVQFVELTRKLAASRPLSLLAPQPTGTTP